MKTVELVRRVSDGVSVNLRRHCKSEITLGISHISKCSVNFSPSANGPTSNHINARIANRVGQFLPLPSKTLAILLISMLSRTRETSWMRAKHFRETTNKSSRPILNRCMRGNGRSVRMTEVTRKKGLEVIEKFVNKCSKSNPITMGLLSPKWCTYNKGMCTYL